MVGTMSAGRHKISDNRPIIRQLDETAINRIAAGEVVERPASAVKELVENAIDAEATRIDIVYADAGKTLVRVADNGCGMTAEDLPLALARHATSKLSGSDLLNIRTFGFRGEALPSMGAAGRLTITSRSAGAEGASIAVSGGRVGPVKPAALNGGTVAELRDLFHATPARLKFMRSDRAEAQAIADIVKRLAMAEPFITFTLRDVSGGGAGREVFRADAETGEMSDALHGRLGRVLGQDFIDNSIRIEAEREGIGITGHAGLPTYSRGSTVWQFLFVNNRPVRDKLLMGALRGAYNDFIPRDRYPAAALFLNCDPRKVDVNVHPAKAEVRFREPGIVRGLMVSGLRHALAEARHHASSTVGDGMLEAMRRETGTLNPARSWHTKHPIPQPGSAHDNGFAPTPPDLLAEATARSGRFEPPPADEVIPTDLPLGVARAQVHENYIIAQTTDSVVIVDQHAAHERLVYERLKRQMAENGIEAQALLIPEIVNLSREDASRILDRADDLARLGLTVEPFGPGSVAVRETPALLGLVDAAGLIRDILDELAELGESRALESRLEAILSRIACHGSIRSGRRMQADEMNALLREIEATPHSGQCNHGRPTHVELKMKDIERLFGRA